MTQQLRIDFPDYSAHEQEVDAARYQNLQEREVYLVKVDGAWGGYIPCEEVSLTINGKRGEELGEFFKKAVKQLKKFNIKGRFRCVLNYGIEEEVKKYQYLIQKFNEGR